jgi:hypothetical protein
MSNIAKNEVPESAVDNVINPMKRFAKDSYQLINRCTKPDAKGKFNIHVLFWMYLLI